MKVTNEKANLYLKDLQLSQQTGVALVSPLTASIAINYWCNSRCNYCSIWRLPMKNVDLDDLKLVTRQLKDIGVNFLSMSGGEPFLYPQLADYISFLNELKIFSSVMTNGMLLTPEKLIPILESRPNSICLSLDSIDPDTYLKLRGVRLEPILKGLDYLLSLKKEYPKFKVSVNCVVSRANINQLPDLVDYCSQRNVYVGFQPLHSNFGEWQVQSEKLHFSPDDKEMLITLMDKVITMKFKGRLISCQSEYLRGFPDFLTSRRLPDEFRCSAGLTTIAIDHMLNIKSCWFMKSIGQIKEENLSDLWHSDKYAKRRLEMAELNCPRCWLRCHTEHCSQEWINTFFNYISI